MSELRGCVCSWCGQSYETPSWSAPFLCDLCASARIRFEEWAAKEDAFRRWCQVQAEIAAA